MHGLFIILDILLKLQRGDVKVELVYSVLLTVTEYISDKYEQEI